MMSKRVKRAGIWDSGYSSALDHTSQLTRNTTSTLVRQIYERWSFGVDGNTDFDTSKAIVPYYMFLRWISHRIIFLSNGAALTGLLDKNCLLLMTAEGEMIELCRIPGCWLPAHADILGFPACNLLLHQSITTSIKYLYPVAIERIMGQFPLDMALWTRFIDKSFANEKDKRDCNVSINSMHFEFRKREVPQLSASIRHFGRLSINLLCSTHLCFGRVGCIRNEPLTKCHECRKDYPVPNWKTFTQQEWMSRSLRSPKVKILNYLRKESSSAYWQSIHSLKILITKLLVSNHIYNLEQLPTGDHNLTLANRYPVTPSLIANRICCVKIGPLELPVVVPFANDNPTTSTRNSQTGGEDFLLTLTTSPTDLLNIDLESILIQHDLHKLHEFEWISNQEYVRTKRADANLAIQRASIFNDIQLRAHLARTGNWWRVSTEQDEKIIVLSIHWKSSMLVAVFVDEGVMVELCWWKGCVDGFSYCNEHLLCPTHERLYQDLLYSFPNLQNLSSPPTQDMQYCMGPPATFQAGIHPLEQKSRITEEAVINCYGHLHKVQSTFGVQTMIKRKGVICYLESTGSTHSSGSVQLGTSDGHLMVRSTKLPISSQKWEKICDECFGVSVPGENVCLFHLSSRKTITEKCVISKLVEIGQLASWTDVNMFILHKNIIPKLLKNSITLCPDFILKADNYMGRTKVTAMIKGDSRHLCGNFEIGCESLCERHHIVCLKCDYLVRYTVYLLKCLFNGEESYAVIIQRGVLGQNGIYASNDVSNVLAASLYNQIANKNATLSNIEIICSEKQTTSYEEALSWKSAYIIFANIESTVTGYQLKILNRRPHVTRFVWRAVGQLCKRQGLYLRRSGRVYLKRDPETGRPLIDKVSSIELVHETPKQGVMNPRVYIIEDIMGRIYVGLNELGGSLIFFPNMAALHYFKNDRTNFRYLSLTKEDMCSNKVVALLKHGRFLNGLMLETIFQLYITASTELDLDVTKPRHAVNGFFSYCALPHGLWFLEFQHIMVARLNWTFEIIEDKPQQFRPLFNTANLSKIGLEKLSLDPRYFSNINEPAFIQDDHVVDEDQWQDFVDPTNDDLSEYDSVDEF